MTKSKSGLTATSAAVYLRKRRQIDTAFAEMASDSDYQNESLRISAEFAQSNWDAYEAGESET
jgi:hypothetical protein